MNKILVVEDDNIIAMDIQAMLHALGYEVLPAAPSGEVALARIEKGQPDLVLMDIRLKGKLDGIETTGRIRERWDLPVVYLTSHSDEATLARAKETAPHGYLLKPFHERDLRTSIEVALGKHMMERKLAARERWFSTTLRSIGDAVIATDGHDRITFMNAVAEGLTGWKEQDAVGKALSEVFRLVDEHGAPREGAMGRTPRGGFRAELPPGTQLVRRGGEVRHEIDDSSAPIVDERGATLGWVVIFRDITERKKLEARLSQSERMASIGTMAAGVAHEINNPLAAVVGNVDFAAEGISKLQRDGARPAGEEGFAAQLEELSDALIDAREGADRVRRIVQDLKKFSRVERADKEMVDLPMVLDAAVRMTENQLRHRAVLRREYGVTPFVLANEGQLVQVFTNLLANAAQAIPDGSAAENQIRIATRTDDAGRAVAEVHDSGCGIPTVNLPRLFEPFFSTKANTSGMGLGLAICHSLVTSWGGVIEVESKVEHGTMFRVSLPAAPPQGASRPAPRERPGDQPTSGRRGRILVIDDEPAIGRIVTRLLSRQHDVVTEQEGSAAMARIARGEVFDLIFCDVMMPNMSGVEIHDLLRASRPELSRRMVFLTGGAFSDESEAFLGSIENLVVAKPFAAESLLALVNDFLK